MAQHKVMDGVMKELMRGIKIAAEPINQHNCAQNDTEAISNTGQGAKGGGAGWGRTGGGRVTYMVVDAASQCQEHIDDVLWLLEQFPFYTQDDLL